MKAEIIVQYMAEVLAEQPSITATALAEATANHFEHDDWLDDEHHWVWDIAADMTDETII